MIHNTVYSHSEYYDVLDVFMNQWRKYYDKPITVFSNTQYKREKTIIYDSSMPYCRRLKSCLEKVEEEIVLYQHEDMFLYDFPDSERIDEYARILSGSDKSFIRLTKAGACKFSQSDLHVNLLNISEDSENFFAVQSSLWKRLDLMSFLSAAQDKGIWETESCSPLINCQQLFLRGLCHFDNERVRGHHHDSNVWPYIATAINKGNWNFSEYSKELRDMDGVLNSKRAKC